LQTKSSTLRSHARRRPETRRGDVNPECLRKLITLVDCARLFAPAIAGIVARSSADGLVRLHCPEVALYACCIKYGVELVAD